VSTLAPQPNLRGKPIGEILLTQQKLTAGQLNEALALSKQWGTPLGSVLQSQGFVSSFHFHRALALQLGKHFVDVNREPPHEQLLQVEDMAEYQRLVVMPWRRQDGKVWLVTARPGLEVDEFGARRYGDQFEVAVTSKFDVLWTLQKHFGGEMTRAALSSLADAAPEYSARVVITPRQVGGLAVLTLVFGAEAVSRGAAGQPAGTALMLTAGITLAALALLPFAAALALRLNLR
jgi:hypothetical protein